MVDHDPPADTGAWVNLDPRQHSREMRNYTSGEAKSPSPQPVRETMKGNRMQSRIAEKHLDTGPGRGVAGHDRIDSLNPATQHGRHVFCVISGCWSL
jgi:hypothetical protein